MGTKNTTATDATKAATPAANQEPNIVTDSPVISKEAQAFIDQQTAEIEALKAENLSMKEIMKKEASQVQTVKILEGDLATEKEKSAKLTEELKVAGEVTAELKKQLKEKVSKAKLDDGLKLGTRKFKLLFGVKHDGVDVTEDLLRENEDLLAKLVESGSGAIQEIL